MVPTAPPPTPDAGLWSYDLLPLLDAGAVFVHIPKTGGLSVARAVYGTEGGGHRTIQDYRRELGAGTLARLVTFTVVRDPVERLASAFHYLKRGGINRADRAFRDGPLAPYRNLDAFVRGWLSPEAAAGQVHFRPQHTFVCNGAGAVAVDHVLRHERLAEGYAALRPAISGGPLPHLNATSGSSARAAAELSAPALRVVGRIYARDFELFGYPFLSP